jgi:hypothetical protein
MSQVSERSIVGGCRRWIAWKPGVGGESPAFALKRVVRDLTDEIALLTRTLKVPTLRKAEPRLADRALAESWAHELILAACLQQREVAAHEAHGGEGRIRAARFPARKSLEEFDFDHAGGPRRDAIAHLSCRVHGGRDGAQGQAAPNHEFRRISPRVGSVASYAARRAGLRDGLSPET